MKMYKISLLFINIHINFHIFIYWFNYLMDHIIFPFPAPYTASWLRPLRLLVLLCLKICIPQNLRQTKSTSSSHNSSFILEVFENKCRWMVYCFILNYSGGIREEWRWAYNPCWSECTRVKRWSLIINYYINFKY